MNLNAIRDSFLTRNFAVEEIRAWLIGVATICALLLIIFIVRTIRQRRLRYKPFGNITDPKAIRDLIRLAFDQRRMFEVQVQTDSDTRRPTLRCSPEYLGASSLTIELGGVKSLSEHWLGRKLTVFFRLRINDDFVYYTFNSQIGGIHTPQEGVCHITLPLPAVMENRQKRAFLRLSPPPDLVLGAALWHGDYMPTPETLQDLAGWPRPRLLYLQDRVEQFHIIDISAGGMRISVPQEVQREFRLQFAAVEQLIIMLDLREPEMHKRLRYWIQCRIQNIWRESQTRDILMGLQFQAWARPREIGGETNSTLEWLKLSPAHEVEPIGNWIMRRHLELFREFPGETH